MLRKSSMEMRRGPDGAALPSNQSSVNCCGWLVPKSIRADLDAPVSVLDLSKRSARAVEPFNLQSIRQLLECPRKAFMGTVNFGSRSMKELQGKLFEYLSGHRQRVTLFPIGATKSVGTKRIVSKLLGGLPEHNRKILAARYGLWGGVQETLVAIGEKLGVTRERVRQIEAKSLERIAQQVGSVELKRWFSEKLNRRVLAGQSNHLGLLGEDDLVAALADDCTQAEARLAVAFLQDLCRPTANLFRELFTEVKEGFYCTGPVVERKYMEALEAIRHAWRERRGSMDEAELCAAAAKHWAGRRGSKAVRFIRRILAVSHGWARLVGGMRATPHGPPSWRRDLTTLAQTSLASLGRPAHYRGIRAKILALCPELPEIDDQTLRRRLEYRSDRFVWVGLGTYGLAAWGLEKPRRIKERLIDLLPETGYPLPYSYLERGVLEACDGNGESVRMTLDRNPKLFNKFEGDLYGLRKLASQEKNRKAAASGPEPARLPQPSTALDNAHSR